MLCKYKDIFGSPNTGLHKYRVFNIAIVDLSLTIILALLLSYLINYNFFIIFIILFLIGIILHKIFCVKTTLTKIIFKN